jgi:hypothetical protein
LTGFGLGAALGLTLWPARAILRARFFGVRDARVALAFGRDLRGADLRVLAMVRLL